MARESPRSKTAAPLLWIPTFPPHCLFRDQGSGIGDRGSGIGDQGSEIHLIKPRSTPAPRLLCVFKNHSAVNHSARKLPSSLLALASTSLLAATTPPDPSPTTPAPRPLACPGIVQRRRAPPRFPHPLNLSFSASTPHNPSSASLCDLSASAVPSSSPFPHFRVSASTPPTTPAPRPFATSAPPRFHLPPNFRFSAFPLFSIYPPASPIHGTPILSHLTPQKPPQFHHFAPLFHKN